MLGLRINVSTALSPAMQSDILFKHATVPTTTADLTGVHHVRDRIVVIHGAGGEGGEQFNFSFYKYLLIMYYEYILCLFGKFEIRSGKKERVLSLKQKEKTKPVCLFASDNFFQKQSCPLRNGHEYVASASRTFSTAFHWVVFAVEKESTHHTSHIILKRTQAT